MRQRLYDVFIGADHGMTLMLVTITWITTLLLLGVSSIR